MLNAPSQPRGGGGFRGGFGRGGGEIRRTSLHYTNPSIGGRGSSVGGGGGGGGGGAPTGPRGSSFGSPGPGPSFRGGHNNSSSTTYPRTQRFTDHLSDLPRVVPGGQKYPDPVDRSKATKLEEEAARLREQIVEMEARKRQGLREWDKLERESEKAALRSEMADNHLRELNGEGDLGGAAF